MPITNSDLANRWNISPSRVSQLIKEGLPLDSIEAAEAWRDGRSGRAAIWANKRANDSGAPSPAGEAEADAEPSPAKSEGNSDPGSLETLVEYQLRIVTVARNGLARAMRENLGPQKVKAASDTLDKAVNTYAKLRREARAELIASRTLILSATAIERFRKVFGLLVSELERLEVEVAPLANPSNPGLAMKAFREARIRLQKKLSDSASASVQSLTGEDFGGITLPDDPEADDDSAPIGTPDDDGEADEPAVDDDGITKG